MPLQNRQFQFDKGLTGLAKLSVKSGIKPDTIAQMIIEQKRPEYIKYVKSGGLVPDANPVKLALQTIQVHDARVREKSKKTGKPYAEAEQILLAEDERNSYTGGGDAENFAPLLLSTAYKLGSSAVPKINEQRASQGKKPLFSGPVWQKLKGIASKYINLERVKEDVGLNQPEPVQEEKPDKLSFIKKNKVYIIIGLVLVGVGIWYYIKKRK